MKSFILITLLLLTACAGPTTAAHSSVDRAMPALGVVLDDAQTVIDLDPSGAADNGGVHKGDVLIALEGHAFAGDPQGVKQVITEIMVAIPDTAPLPATSIITLSLRRAGQEMNLPINIFGSTRSTARPPLPTVTALPPDVGLSYF